VRQRLGARARRREPRGVESVVDGQDLRGGDARGDELAADGVGVGDDGLREPEHRPLQSPLRGRAQPLRLAAGGDADGDAGERRAQHAEGVGVEAVCVDDAHALAAQVAREA
jgi:hypothetical protein